MGEKSSGAARNRQMSSGLTRWLDLGWGTMLHNLRITEQTFCWIAQTLQCSISTLSSAKTHPCTGRLQPTPVCSEQ